MYEYKPKGTCSTKIHFDIRDSKVHSVSFENGCDGNLKAISALAEGMDTDELIKKLKGIKCGRKGTSCGDQFAEALEKYK
ncbi:TSCPD domain-containing protein [Spirochaetia bacterium]|nr:TSCPD domain-containing protein [Spirochaetia bacterium]